MTATKTQALQKKTISVLTREAARIRADLQEYLGDLEMYSKPEFWEAVNETIENHGKSFSSAKALFKELDD